MLNSRCVFIEQVEQLPGSRGGSLSGLCYAFQEELEPLFPIAIVSEVVQQLVVSLAALLEVQTQIKHRLAQYPVVD